MAKEEKEKIEFQIRHDYNGKSHYDGRSSTKCHGLSVTFDEGRNVLYFNGLHSKGVGSAIGLCMNADCIDKLIDKLTKMREDVVIGNI